MHSLRPERIETAYYKAQSFALIRNIFNKVNTISTYKMLSTFFSLEPIFFFLKLAIEHFRT
jgi:hypothetical protein